MKKTIGNRIQELISEYNRDDQWLADAIGKHRTTVARIINGETTPNRSTVHLIANALNSTYSYLVFGTGDKRKVAEPEQKVVFDPAVDVLYKEMKEQVLYYRQLLLQVTGGKSANFLKALNETGLPKRRSLGAAA